MGDYDWDLAVIGAGSGGVRAARMSASFGAKVAIIEGADMGGTCVNIGCVPKKLFVYAASYAEAFEDARGFGWSSTRPAFDWKTLVDAKNREIKRLNGIYDSILEKAGVEIIRGFASFEDAHTLRVGDRTVSAETILIATGGKPWRPEIPGHEMGISSNECFFLDSLPERVVIAGGGYIGVEFAGIFKLLGVDVHIVHRGDLLLNRFDEDIRRHLTSQMRLKGIHVHLDQTIERLDREGESIVATLKNGEKLAAGLQMAAVGRRPNTDGLNLEAAGVDVDSTRGGIVVDDDFRTSTSNIYAIGDVIDRLQLTPVALAEGMALAKTLYGGTPTSVDYETIPTAVFSTPNVGTVGLPEAAAWHRGYECKIFRSVFTPMKHTLSGRHEEDDDEARRLRKHRSRPRRAHGRTGRGRDHSGLRGGSQVRRDQGAARLHDRDSPDRRGGIRDDANASELEAARLQALVFFGAQREMQSALALLAQDASVARVHVVGGRQRGVNVPDRSEALRVERVVWEIVRIHVGFDVVERPAEDRMDLHATVLGADARQRAPMLGLIGAQARHPGARPERIERALHRLDLVPLQVLLHPVGSLLPGPAVERLLARRCHARTEDVQVQTEALLELIREAVGLGEEVARVDEDDRRLGRDARDQVQHHGRLRPEAGRHDQAGSEAFRGPRDDFLGAGFGQLPIRIFEPDLCSGFHVHE